MEELLVLTPPTDEILVSNLGGSDKIFCLFLGSNVELKESLPFSDLVEEEVELLQVFEDLVEVLLAAEDTSGLSLSVASLDINSNETEVSSTSVSSISSLISSTVTKSPKLKSSKGSE